MALSEISKKLASIIVFSGTVRVISHQDADGIAASAIILRSLLRKNMEFHLTLIKSLDDARIASLKNENNDTILFLDMGSGKIDQLETIDAKTLVIDHHIPLRDSTQVTQLNSHLFGVDGTSSACASSLAYLVAKAMDEANADLVDIALAGIVGDKQLPLMGINETIVAEGIERGTIKTTELRFRNMTELENSVDPFIEASEALIAKLKGANIPDEFVGLREPQQRSLKSLLALTLIAQNVNSHCITKVLSANYYLQAFGTSAEEVAAVLNACGRLRAKGLGVELCLKKDIQPGLKLEDEYTALIRRELRKLNDAVTELEHIQYFRPTTTELGGVLAGLGMDYVLNREKPTFSLVRRDTYTKVSSRATKYLVRKGVNLALALSEASQQVGGFGGGHDIAAGATIEPEQEAKFLKLLDDIIGEQMGTSGN